MIIDSSLHSSKNRKEYILLLRTIFFSRHVTFSKCGNMDPHSVGLIVNDLLDKNFDVIRILHDNDATAIERARATKIKWQTTHQNQILLRCACAGTAAVTKNGKVVYCRDGDICRGIKESLCVRHGFTQAVKDMKKLAKSLPNIKVDGRKRNQYLNTEHGRRYCGAITKIIYSLAADHGGDAKARRDFVILLYDGFRKHMLGDHSNTFCQHYGRCKQVGYTQTHRIVREDEKEVLDKWIQKYKEPARISKYLDTETTNPEESANSLMLMFLPKRLASVDAAAYDCAAIMVLLFLNEGGWNFLEELHQRLGLPLTPFQEKEITQLEQRAQTRAGAKLSAKAQQGRINNKRLRQRDLKKSKYKERDTISEQRKYNIADRSRFSGEYPKRCIHRDCAANTLLGCYSCANAYCLKCAVELTLIPNRRYPVNTKKSRHIVSGEWWCASCDDGSAPLFWTFKELDALKKIKTLEKERRKRARAEARGSLGDGASSSAQASSSTAVAGANDGDEQV